MKKHTRNHKVLTITLPPEDIARAKEMLPYGEARTLSALIRFALKLLPRIK